MSSRGHGPKYTPGKEIEEMMGELTMMHGMYEDLCKAYKRLAMSIGAAPEGELENTTKKFGDWEKEKLTEKEDRYGN